METTVRKNGVMFAAPKGDGVQKLPPRRPNEKRLLLPFA
jgi:hypothetical protein